MERMTPLRDSIQWRIFLYYTAIFSVAVALLFAGHFWTTLQSVRRTAKARMQEQAVHLLPEAFPPPDWTKAADNPLSTEPPVTRGPVERREFHKIVAKLGQEQIYVILVNWKGQEIYRSKNAPRDFYVIASPGGPLKLNPDALSLGVEVHTRLGDVLALGQPRKAVEAQTLHTLPQTIATAVCVLGLFSFLGFRLIKHGLKPIREISRAAEHIANGALSERIAISSQTSELGQLANVLNHTFNQLESVLLRQKQFTADASHELRTPVASILADCEFSLKRERPPERYRETIEVCREAARHMRKIIESLGLLSRFDAEAVDLQKTPCDLACVAAQALALVQPLARKHTIELLTELAPAPCRGDTARLEQVAVNLLSNAILYNRASGKVHLRTGSAEGKAFLVVEDNGPGIPEDKIERIFDRFFRLDTTRRHPESGSGLGLAICKAIMEAHGGEIKATSKPGSGAHLAITLEAIPSAK
ncbi:MAG: sensor histidine kinase [Chthoniobacteraceae bacterium]